MSSVAAAQAGGHHGLADPGPGVRHELVNRDVPVVDSAPTQLAAEGKPNITRSCDASMSWVRRITRTVRCRLTNPGVMLKA